MVLFFFPWAGIYLFIFDKGQEYFIFMKKYICFLFGKWSNIGMTIDSYLMGTCKKYS
jgi:hypothetical protein